MWTSCVSPRWRASALAALVAALSGCGGGTTSVTTITGLGSGAGASVVSSNLPSAANATPITVDAGPASAFSVAVNAPYVTVTVCAPGSTNACATIDHVLLDTGSIGLRVLRSAVIALGLPAVTLPANAATGAAGGAAAECYLFVLGGLWGPVVNADVRIADELAPAIPIQLIDDAPTPLNKVPPDCSAASNGALSASAASLQANGILGVGMVAYDCGLACATGQYPSGMAVPYYACTGGAASVCTPAAVDTTLQTQNPVARFAKDNNGTIITLPALPSVGAGVAQGLLTFGIGTQANNQLPATAQHYYVGSDSNDMTNYLNVLTTSGGTAYANSYIDSGTNAIFFNDTSIPGCQTSGGSSGGWYCPSTTLSRTATISDHPAPTLPVASTLVGYMIANADALFSTSGAAFSDLAGTVPMDASSFVWGLSFFYGRSVATSIWGQTGSASGPWYAF